MKVLLTGANGYIGKRVLPMLVDAGLEVVCAVRNQHRFSLGPFKDDPRVSVVEIDVLNPPAQVDAIADIDVAYYLIHSMSDDSPEFRELEEQSAQNFVALIDKTSAKQIIYLGGIINEEKLSEHLASRKRVGEIIATARAELTTLRAGIIVGSGSSSFEIIRDLVEKLPVMITPRWVATRTQPIAIRNVLEALTGVLMRAETFGRSYDIGGPEVMTYKQMMLDFAEARGLRRYIFTVPVLTPKLSSYWLYFVTNTSYRLAVNLVNSMKIEVVARNNDLFSMLGIRPLPYKAAVELAFQKIEQNEVASSWKDSLVSSFRDNSLLEYAEVPTNGCFTDRRLKPIRTSAAQVLDNIWSIGGRRGWYYANWLWSLRGVLDKFFGGVGLRRGRTNPEKIFPGDTLDFWRVLVADRENGRLLLYAEMKLPGEAWLEFRISHENGGPTLEQTATFRPRGVLGRLYWYAVLPFHYFVFDGMAENLVAFVASRKPGSGLVEEK